jgi:hypothetical protein
MNVKYERRNLKMPGKRVVLSAINSELRLRTSGVTIRVNDNDPEKSGRLRIGKAKVQWIPFRKSTSKGEKTWEDLIDFIMKKH